jgi:hypothetical protein
MPDEESLSEKCRDVDRGLVVFFELWAIAFIRARYMDTPFLRSPPGRARRRHRTCRRYRDRRVVAEVQMALPDATPAVWRLLITASSKTEEQEAIGQGSR